MYTTVYVRLFDLYMNNTKVLELWYHAIVKIAKTADMKRYNRGNCANLSAVNITARTMQ